MGFMGRLRRLASSGFRQCWNCRLVVHKSNAKGDDLLCPICNEPTHNYGYCSLWIGEQQHKEWRAQNPEHEKVAVEALQREMKTTLKE